MRTTAFKVAFFASVCLFTAFNSVSYAGYWMRLLFNKFGPFSIYDFDAYGFPFSFYLWNVGISSWSIFFRAELAANVVVALVISFLIGWLSAVVRSRIKTS